MKKYTFKIIKYLYCLIPVIVGWAALGVNQRPPCCPRSAETTCPTRPCSPFWAADWPPPVSRCHASRSPPAGRPIRRCTSSRRRTWTPPLQCWLSSTVPASSAPEVGCSHALGGAGTATAFILCSCLMFRPARQRGSCPPVTPPHTPRGQFFFKLLTIVWCFIFEEKRHYFLK